MRTFLRIISFLAGSFLGLVGIFGLVDGLSDPAGGDLVVAIFTLALCAGLMYYALHRYPWEKAEKAATREAEAQRIEAGKASQRAYAQEQAARRAAEAKEEEERKRSGAAIQRLGEITEIGDDEIRVTCPAWVVLDVETTGLHPESDRVIEFAARRYRDGAIESEYSTLIFPDRRLPKEITELTGIRDRELLKAPRFGEVAQEIASFIGGLPVVAHNAKFDAEFLLYECGRAGIALDIEYIDTVRMARWAFPGMKNYKLNTLISELDLLDHEQDHRAMSDVTATAKLYLKCREEQAYRIELLRRGREQAMRNYVPPSTQRAVDLYNLGSEYEREGKIDLAMTMYGQSVAEGVQMLQPYRRLAILHKKQKDYRAEINDCRAAIQMIEGWGVDQQVKKEEFEKRIAAAEGKLQKAGSP